MLTSKITIFSNDNSMKELSCPMCKFDKKVKMEVKVN